MKTPDWLIMANLNSVIPEVEVIAELYKMIQLTKNVNNLELLIQDFENRKKIISPYFDDKSYVCITKSAFVNDFCASLIKLPDNKKYCISAWKEYTEENLKKLYILSKFLKISEK